MTKIVRGHLRAGAIVDPRGWHCDPSAASPRRGLRQCVGQATRAQAHAASPRPDLSEEAAAQLGPLLRPSRSTLEMLGTDAVDMGGCALSDSGEADESLVSKREDADKRLADAAKQLAGPARQRQASEPLSDWRRQRSRAPSTLTRAFSLRSQSDCTLRRLSARRGSLPKHDDDLLGTPRQGFAFVVFACVFAFLVLVAAQAQVHVEGRGIAQPCRNIQLPYRLKQMLI